MPEDFIMCGTFTGMGGRRKGKKEEAESLSVLSEKSLRDIYHICACLAHIDTNFPRRSHISL